MYVTVPRFDGIGLDSPKENSQPAPKPISITLLYAMMAVASRYSNKDKANVPQKSLWSAGLDYADKVRELICELFGLDACALLLILYYQTGEGYRVVCLRFKPCSSLRTLTLE